MFTLHCNTHQSIPTHRSRMHDSSSHKIIPLTTTTIKTTSCRIEPHLQGLQCKSSDFKSDYVTSTSVQCSLKHHTRHTAVCTVLKAIPAAVRQPLTQQRGTQMMQRSASHRPKSWCSLHGTGMCHSNNCAS